MRFLCLHGMGTNSKVFELQTAAIRYELGEADEFDFADGTIPCPPDPAVTELLAPGEQCYAYYGYTEESVKSALEDLDSYIQLEGPFDAVMGFSQGAALAARYIIRHTQQDPFNLNPVFKCAVFICAGGVLEDGDERSIPEPGVIPRPSIEIPTVHVFGCKDEHFDISVRLSAVCDSRTRETIDHRGGHEVPRSPKITARIAQAIESVMNKAMIAG